MSNRHVTRRVLSALAVAALVAVTAQTLPAHGASTRILRKMGLVMTGSVVHPTDGEVWEWREPRPTERGAEQ